MITFLKLSTTNYQRELEQKWILILRDHLHLFKQKREEVYSKFKISPVSVGIINVNMVVLIFFWNKAQLWRNIINHIVWKHIAFSLELVELHFNEFCAIGRVKNTFSSQTERIILVTTFSQYLGQNATPYFLVIFQSNGQNGVFRESPKFEDFLGKNPISPLMLSPSRCVLKRQFMGHFFWFLGDLDFIVLNKRWLITASCLQQCFCDSMKCLHIIICLLLNMVL